MLAAEWWEFQGIRGEEEGRAWSQVRRGRQRGVDRIYLDGGWKEGAEDWVGRAWPRPGSIAGGSWHLGRAVPWPVQV